jgi:hypothetical protein
MTTESTYPLAGFQQLQARLREEAARQERRLLERAAGLRYDIDYENASGLIVWDPAVRGRCKVVTPERCSCREWRVWRRYPHKALRRDLFDRRTCSQCGASVPRSQLSDPDGTGVICVRCL